MYIQMGFSSHCISQLGFSSRYICVSFPLAAITYTLILYSHTSFQHTLTTVLQCRQHGSCTFPKSHSVPGPLTPARQNDLIPVLQECSLLPMPHVQRISSTPGGLQQTPRTPCTLCVASVGAPLCSRTVWWAPRHAPGVPHHMHMLICTFPTFQMPHTVVLMVPVPSRSPGRRLHPPIV